MLAGVIALLFGSAVPAIQLSTPAGSGPVSLAVITVPPGGHFLNFLTFPPSAERPEGDTGSLLEHSGVQVGRVLAGPGLPRRITLRQVYPEMAAMFRISMRRLAFLERTDSGYWHVQWQARIQEGRVCIPADAIAHFRLTMKRRTPDRNGAICLNL